MDDRVAHRVHDIYPDTGRIDPKVRGLVGPERVSWRMLSEGSLVWAPTGKGWTPAVVTRLGRQRDERTVVHLLLFGRNGQRKGIRFVNQLFWRRERNGGKDKPHD